MSYQKPRTSQERALERAAIRRAGGGHSLAKLVMGGKTVRCEHGNTPNDCQLCRKKLP